MLPRYPFKLQQPINEWALPKIVYDYTLPKLNSVPNRLHTSAFLKQVLDLSCFSVDRGFSVKFLSAQLQFKRNPRRLKLPLFIHSPVLGILTSFWVFNLLCSFQMFFIDFSAEIEKNVISAKKSLINVWNEQKSLKTAQKKYFNQLLDARSTQKLVKIHNSPESIKSTNFENVWRTFYNPLLTFQRMK